MRFGSNLLLHGIRLWVQFHPDRCMSGSRPNESHLFSVNTYEMYHNSTVICNGTLRFDGKLVNVAYG